MDLGLLNMGDIIVRQKGFITTHYMVYVGTQSGIQMVAENQRGVGVQIVSLQKALANNLIKRIEKFSGTESDRHTVLPRIKKLLGKPYDLIRFNCEHFARWISNGKMTSKQVETVSLIALLGGIGFSMASLTAKKNGVFIILAIVLFLISISVHLLQKKK